MKRRNGGGLGDEDEGGIDEDDWMRIASHKKTDVSTPH